MFGDGHRGASEIYDARLHSLRAKKLRCFQYSGLKPFTEKTFSSHYILMAYFRGLRKNTKAGENRGLFYRLSSI